MNFCIPLVFESKEIGSNQSLVDFLVKDQVLHFAFRERNKIVKREKQKTQNVKNVELFKASI